MKKGFTLIELLAVIVILAVIALIATPIVLNIISDAKEESEKRSIEMYAKAVENAVVTYQLKNGKPITNVTEIYDYIEVNGNTYCNEIQIHENGSVYVGDCYVESKKVDYTFGTKTEYEEFKFKVVDSAGNTPKNNSVSQSTILYIKLSDGLNINDVSVKPELTIEGNMFAVTSNGVYDFEINTKIDGTLIYSKTRVIVNAFQYLLEKVEYNELASGEKSYTLSKDINGKTEDTVLKTENLGWRLLEISEKGKILLIADKLVTQTYKVSLASSADNYINGPKILDEICDELYGKGTYALRARNLKIEDLLRARAPWPNERIDVFPKGEEQVQLNDYYQKEYGWDLRATNGGSTDSNGNDVTFTKYLKEGNAWTNTGIVSSYQKNPKFKKKVGSLDVYSINSYFDGSNVKGAYSYYIDNSSNEMNITQKHTGFTWKIEYYVPLTQFEEYTTESISSLLSLISTISKANFWLSSNYVDVSGNIAEYGMYIGKSRIEKDYILYKDYTIWQDFAPMGNMLNEWNGGVYEYALAPVIELDASKVNIVRKYDASGKFTNWEIVPKEG